MAHLKPELRVRVKTHMLGLGPLTSLGENPVSGAGNRERGALTPASELTKEATKRKEASLNHQVLMSSIHFKGQFRKVLRNQMALTQRNNLIKMTLIHSVVVSHLMMS